MALKISTRKQFLAQRKADGNRVTIGFAGIADLRSFIAFEYLNGIMKACEDYDINFINMGGAVKYSLFDDIHFIQNYMKNFKFMRPPFIDGLVTWTSSFWDFMKEDKIISTFSELNPLPMVDIGYMNIPNTTHLKINSNIAIQMMMEHLTTEHNYSKFAFFGADTSQPHWNRLNQYQHFLRNHGIPEIENSIYMAKSMNINHIAEKVEELVSAHDLHNKKSIEAIITTTDIIASEVIEQLARHNISVPKDVAVTGFNNWYEGITSRSPLTTIDLSYYKRGYAAVEILIDRIIEPSTMTETILFEPSLVIRQSCGCLEHSIQKVSKEFSESKLAISENLSESELRETLQKRTQEILPYQPPEKISELINDFFEDLYGTKSESKLVLWFQNILQNQRKSRNFDTDSFQNYITQFRSLLLPLIKNEGMDTLLKMENIFHQMRSLISVFQKYESIAERENPYNMNNISEQAINFTTATTVDKVFEILKNQLSDFDVPGFALALNDTMTHSFPMPELKFIYPEPTEEQNFLLNQKISEPHLFPKKAFPEDRRYSLMLEVLHHADYYFGYAFFEMKQDNIATYDVLKMLLSNALYSVYKDKSASTASVTPTSEQISSIIKENSEASTKRNRITADQITTYLTEHLNEMTDVEKMAEKFMVSKSYLSKKTKELTGHSIQTLHEKLKIEQAKNMLLLDNFELSKIASELGFANQNYFSNVFKKNTGLSPKNWLKERK